MTVRESCRSRCGGGGCHCGETVAESGKKVKFNHRYDYFLHARMYIRGRKISETSCLFTYLKLCEQECDKKWKNGFII